MTPRLKICGVNDGAFAVEAERLGADYLGFVFVPGTPRAVTPVHVAAFRRALRGRARTVGVFLRETPAAILPIVQTLGLDVVQLHRRATEADVSAFRAAGVEVWTLAGGAAGDGLLFDSSHGDGETVVRHGAWKTVLAGGISAANLAVVLRRKPDVVDVSSALESSPGVKSISRLRTFMSVWASQKGSLFC